MNILYRFRGVILGFFALILLLVPPRTGWVPASALIVLLGGIVLRIEARRAIGEHSRGSDKAAPELVTWGIYARLRHPLYLSNFCVGMGFVLWHLGWCEWTFAFASFLLAFLFALARAEDEFLEKSFGDFFRVWARRTPMFFPARESSASPEFLARHPRRSVLSAIRADRWTWIWILCYTLLLVLRERLFPLALAS